MAKHAIARHLETASACRGVVRASRTLQACMPVSVPGAPMQDLSQFAHPLASFLTFVAASPSAPIPFTGLHFALFLPEGGTHCRND